MRRTFAGIVVATALALAGAELERLVAQEKPEAPRLWVTEVDVDAETGEVHLLLSVGRDGGLERGDVLEIERDGKKIASATVFTAYPDMAVATVKKSPAGRVARGDWIKVKARAPRAARVEEGPVKVASVGEGAATLAGGTARGLKKGQEGTLLRDGKPVGRVRVDSVESEQAVVAVIEGEAAPGDTFELAPKAHEHGKADPLAPDLTRDELRRLERSAEKNPRYDFVGTGFLGVVAEIEHPTPVAAGCHVGVLVKRVIQGSPADLAKIRAGDRVIAIDERVVRTPAEIHRGIQRRTQDAVRVTVIRDDVLHVVTADFTRR